MAEPSPPAPSPSQDDMHWGISYLREDLQDVKHDSRDFRKEVQQQFAETRRDFNGKIAEVRTEIAELRADVNGKIAEVRTEIAELRADVNEQIAALRGHVDHQIVELRGELHQGLRHNLLTMIAIGGIYTGIIIAFIEYRFPG